MSETALYEISGLKFGYNHNFILEVPDLVIDKGESTGFTGPNGSGKSTLLKILAFLQYPDKGIIKFNGSKISKSGNNTGLTVTMLFQNSYLLKKSVFDNVAYGLRIKNDKKKLAFKVAEALELVGLEPEKFMHKKWSELSGGEAQRVALAARFIIKPDVLILDEPTVSMDRESVILIKKAIDYIRENFNTTLIISSHDTVWLNSIAGKILRIYDGRITGPGDENLIPGPWHHSIDGLWAKKLNNGKTLYAVNPPSAASVAMLAPSDIIISTEYQRGISAQNILEGKIINMSVTKEQKVSLEIDVSGLLLASIITQHAVKELQLIPGMDIWIIFKATSLRWE